MWNRDIRRALPLALAYGLVLASLYLLKPARNALFLSKLGVGQLPYVLLLVAAVGAVFAFVYGRLTERLSVNALVNQTFTGLAVMLLGFRWVLGHSPPGWFFYLFYVWVALYGLVTTSLVWLLANGVFNSGEARRVFGFIGSGGIAGAIVGGLFTSQLAESLGTENLLLVCSGLLLVCLVLFRLLPPAKDTSAQKRQDERAHQGLETLWSNPLLRYLALTTGLIAVIAVVVDVQFNELVDRAFTEQDAKTAFFGRFFAGLSAFSLIFQLLFTPFILRVLGVGTALMLLPSALGVGSLGILLLPGLWAGMAAKGADGGFRHSVHKAASEVLFLPVPSPVKKQTKLFLDTAVDTTATGVGALLVLVLTQQAGVDYEYLSVLSVLAAAGTLVGVSRVRLAYVDAFRHALESRRIDLSQLRTGLAEAGAQELIRPALRSEKARQVVYALDLLAESPSDSLAPDLDTLLSHPTAEVRRRALSLRSRIEPPLTREQLEPLLDDEALGVRATALARLIVVNPERGEPALNHALNGPSTESRVTALRALAELDAARSQDHLDPELIRAWLPEDPAEPLRAELARTLGRLGTEHADAVLTDVLHGASTRVLKAAIEGIGQGKNRGRLSWVVEQLAAVELRGAVRGALVEFGAEAVPMVAELLNRPDVPASIRRALPRVLARIPTQSSVDVLVSHLRETDPLVARAIQRALLKLRADFEDLRFDSAVVYDAIRGIARRYRWCERCLEDLEPRLPDTPPARLLLRSLHEAQAWDVEATFDLLALHHGLDDIKGARHGLRPTASVPERASAIELLENILHSQCRSAALTVLAGPDAVSEGSLTQSLFGREARAPEEALMEIMDGENAWLRACAAHVACGYATPSLRARVRRAHRDPNQFVREAAQRALPV